jgi:hypothetical protein
MLNAKNQLNYFENLEKTIKIALAVHIIVLIAGILMLLWDNVTTLSMFIGIGSFRSLLVLSIVAGVCIFLYGKISKMHKLGDVNIWLDKRFFGFLKRSNETIFHTLLYALRPAERERAFELGTAEKETLSQSVFSKLASDNFLFQLLLQSGIFRFWIWYWVMNYGTVSFTLLTIIAFPFVVFNQSPFSITMFTMIWILAIVYLFSCLALGFRLLRMTKTVAEDIVKSHAHEIAYMLREQLFGGR